MGILKGFFAGSLGLAAIIASNALADHEPEPRIWDVCTPRSEPHYTALRLVSPTSIEEWNDDSFTPELLARADAWVAGKDRRLTDLRWQPMRFPGLEDDRRRLPTISQVCKSKVVAVPSQYCQRLRIEGAKRSKKCEIAPSFPECQEALGEPKPKGPSFAERQSDALRTARAALDQTPDAPIEALRATVSQSRLLEGLSARMAKAIVDWAIAQAARDALNDLAPRFRGHIVHRDCAEKLAEFGISHALGDVNTLQSIRNGYDAVLDGDTNVPGLRALGLRGDPWPGQNFTSISPEETADFFDTTFGPSLIYATDLAVRIPFNISDVPRHFSASDRFVELMQADLPPFGSGNFVMVWVLSRLMLDQYELRRIEERMRLYRGIYDTGMAQLRIGFDQFPDGAGGWFPFNFGTFTVGGTFLPCWDEDGDRNPELLAMLSSNGSALPFLTSTPEIDKVDAERITHNTILCALRWTGQEVHEMREGIFADTDNHFALWTEYPGTPLRAEADRLFIFHSVRADALLDRVTALDNLVP